MKAQAKTSTLLVFFLLSFSFYPLSLIHAQAPQKFNYQAVARDGNTVLANTPLDVKFEILQYSSTGTMMWTETQTGITTNNFGLFNIQVGSEIEISIDWNDGPYFLKVEVDLGNGFTGFGNSELLSVPYALNSRSVTTLEKLDIQGPVDMNPDSALFEVKRNDGQIMFAVYNSGVRMFVEEGPAKGSKGGFAIGGFTPGKGETGEYFRVTTDSVRIYLDNTTTKGSKGGFAIGGFTPGKDNDMVQEYLRVTEDSTRIYIDNTATKSRKGGFAIGGFTPGKGNSIDFLNLSPENYFIGHEAGVKLSGIYNSIIGYQAAKNSIGGNSNVLLGYQAGYNLGSGGSDDNNTIIGYRANFTGRGNDNIIIGSLAGENKSFSSSNIVIGSSAGTNLGGDQNIIIGRSAGKIVTGTNNTVIGDQALMDGSGGNSNVILGQMAGNKNSGSYNVMIGNNTGLSNLSGMNNVYLGTSAGLLNNGNSNIFIGYNAGRNTNDISGQLFIDNSSTDMPLIYGNFETDYFRINGTLEVTEEIVAPSDIRLKENIVQLDKVLPKLAQLHGIYFDWKKIDGLNIKLNDRRQIGVIAQEVEKFFPELVVENEFGYKGVDYSKLTPILIEAVNEQQEIIEQKNRQIDELEKRIEKIEAYLGQMGMR